MTEAGRERLKEGGMEGAYLGDDGRVHIPGKRVTLYSKPSPPRPDKQVSIRHCTVYSHLHVITSQLCHWVSLIDCVCFQEHLKDNAPADTPSDGSTEI